jgi:type II secretory pathway pseudopilin PulG
MASRSRVFEAARRAAPAAGFTYIWVLVAIAIMAAGLAAVGEVAATAAKREKEAELLFVGNQFALAIAEYAASSPGAAQYPQKLEDLLADKRYPNVRRYLRRVYADPMTGRADWGLIRGPGGGIVGVHSQSLEPPLKVGNFPGAYSSFTGATTYSAWRFDQGAAAGGQPAAGQKPGAPSAPSGKAGTSPAPIPGNPALTPGTTPPAAAKPASR